MKTLNLAMIVIIAASISVCEAAGVSESDIRRAITSYTPTCAYVAIEKVKK
jgi:hypothetical protein